MNERLLQYNERSSKPVGGHAVSGPVHLTNPAPVEPTARLGADHVHAAAVPLSGSPAARAGFGDYSDGETARVGSSAPPRSWPLSPPTSGLTSLLGEGWRVRGQTVPQVSSLPAVPAEHVPALPTAHSPAVWLRLGQYPGSTARLGTEDAS